MVSAHWLKPHGTEGSPRPQIITKILLAFNDAFEVFRGIYDEIMAFCVKHPRKIVLIAFLTLVFNLFLMPFVGTELQPTYDSGEFRVNLKAPPGVGLNQLKEWSMPLEETIEAIPEVETEIMFIGGTRTPVNEGGIIVKLKDLDERSRGMLEIMAELRRDFSDIGVMNVNVVTNQGARSDPRPVQIGLRGSDIIKLSHYADELAEKIRAVPGATDVEVVGIDPEPEIIIKLDQTRASQLGLDNTSVGKVVQYAFQGKSTGHSYTIGNNDYDIILQMDKADRRTMQDVSDLMVSTATGSFVRLGDVADVRLGSGPTRIDREGRQRQIAVYANTQGISAGDLLKTIQQELIPSLNMDIGYRYKLIGDSDMMQRVFKEIAKAVILAIVLIFSLHSCNPGG